MQDRSAGAVRPYPPGLAEAYRRLEETAHVGNEQCREMEALGIDCRRARSRYDHGLRDIEQRRRRARTPAARRCFPPSRPRALRHRSAARSSAKSGDSGADEGESEPSSSGRLCACGCGRDISHKRVDALTFGASCRQKISREARRGAGERFEPTAAETCTCEAGFFYRDSDGDAVCGLCGCWLTKIEPRLIDQDVIDALMRTNGTYVARRPAPTAWLDTQAAYKRRRRAMQAIA